MCNVNGYVWYTVCLPQCVHDASALFFFLVYSIDSNICVQVFDVFLNDKHLIVNDLDIFNRVGRGVAHDENIPFRIDDGMLTVNGQSSPLSRDGKFTIDFVKVISIVVVVTVLI